MGVARARRWPRSPRHQAEAPISTAPTRHHSQERIAVDAHRVADRSRRSSSVSAGVGGQERIRLGDEPRTVVGGVADHGLRVDGEPRFASADRTLVGLRSPCRSTGRAHGGGRVRIVSSARRARPGSADGRCSAAPRARRPTGRAPPPAWGSPPGGVTACRRAPIAAPARDRFDVPPSSTRPCPAGTARAAAPSARGRGRAGARRRRPPTRAARSASGVRLGVRELDLEDRLEPSDRRRAGATHEMLPPGSNGGPTSRSQASATSATSAGGAPSQSRADVALPRDRRWSRASPG